MSEMAREALFTDKESMLAVIRDRDLGMIRHSQHRKTHDHCACRIGTDQTLTNWDVEIRKPPRIGPSLAADNPARRPKTRDVDHKQ